MRHRRSSTGSLVVGAAALFTINGRGGASDCAGLIELIPDSAILANQSANAAAKSANDTVANFFTLTEAQKQDL